MTNKTKWIAIILLFIIYHLSLSPIRAQQYTGMTGLLHVPSADMDTVGIGRAGMHALPKAMMPDAFSFEGEKYASSNWYLSFTPVKWVEIGYSFTLMKFRHGLDPNGRIGFYSKDRYFSLKVQPIQEDQWWPSIAIGGNDVWGQHDGHSASFFFRNFYLAASKHYEVNSILLGAHLAYRYWQRDYNKKWRGVVGGITAQPAFYRDLRLIGEYDGHSINIGADCTLFKYLLLQASLQQCKYPAAGICAKIYLY